ncbi:antA/AntB antirepressor family protein [Lachnospiraceae bacterium OttesenSCG-928-D06]|nr:antA/AntB antirepressor family protein [Lachnospiraceae bacterium OttesenSCG-928-D06]
MEYQKRLPILIENENIDGFCVNARDLWKQLECPQGQFTKWVERKFKPYNFVKDVDFAPFSQISLNDSASGVKETVEYNLTLDMAKQLAMIDKKECGFLARRYFILMEKAVKQNMNWEVIRNPLREGYKKMQSALNDYLNRTVQRNADDWDYKAEANALNIIATGFTAQEIRIYVGCQDQSTRDSLTATYNEYLLKLQELNILYLGMNKNRYERYELLKQSFDILFPNALPIKNDVDVNRIVENKKLLLEEVKLKIMEQ